MRCRLALAADLPALAGVLGRAFVDDPMVGWIVGSDDADTVVRAGTDGFFAPVVRAALGRGHTYVADDQGTLVGGAVWSPPDASIFDDASGADLADSLVAAAGAEALERLGVIGELVRAHHPDDEPHFYLFNLGVVVPGRGHGEALLRPVLDRCDADGLPAYLESSNPRNLGFYRRLGFEVVWDAVPGPGGPLMTGMWRAPTSG